MVIIGGRGEVSAATATTTTATSPATTPARSAPTLPAWPVYVIFAGFLGWWVLGASAFVMTVMLIPLSVLLVRSGHVRAPRAVVLWLGFLLCMAASAVMIDSMARYVGFFMRAGTYVGVTVLFLYIYNSTIAARKIINALVALWVSIVVGGWLGVLAPHASFSTPMEKLLPASITSNEFVFNLVHPSFAEIQQPYGVAEAFARPSAPFPFTNAWGCNYALLLPYVFAAIVLARSRWVKVLLSAVLVVSLVPAFSTLNRGLFLGIGIGLSYAALRLAMRGRVKPLVGLTAVALVGGGVAWAGGFFARITERTTASSTTADRASLYEETFRRTLESPLFGWGAPRPSETLQVSVGTQGHLWNIMFSYGFLALAFFAGFLWWAVWRSRAVPTSVALWVHVSMFVSAVSFTYYGFDGPQMAVTMVSAALLFRAVSPPPRPAASVPNQPQHVRHLTSAQAPALTGAR